MYDYEREWFMEEINFAVFTLVNFSITRSKRLHFSSFAISSPPMGCILRMQSTTVLDYWYSIRLETFQCWKRSFYTYRRHGWLSTISKVSSSVANFLASLWKSRISNYHEEIFDSQFLDVKLEFTFKSTIIDKVLPNGNIDLI